MRRRRYLVAVGAAAFAGCTSPADDAPEDDDRPGGQVDERNQQDRDTAHRTADEAEGEVGEPTQPNRDTATQPGNGSEAEVLRHELTETEGGTTIIRGRVRNNSSREINLIRLTGEFYDAEGTILEQSMAVVQYMAPGDTHAFRIWYLNQEEPPSDYDLWIDSTGRSATTENSGEIDVFSHDVQGFEYGHWGVEGKIENVTNRDFREVQIFAKFFAEENFVEYMGLDAVKRFNPDDTYQFQVYYKGRLERESIQRYELLVRYLEE